MNTKLSAGRPSRGKTQQTLASLADDSGEQVRVNFHVSRADHVWLKVYAAQNQTTIADLLRAKIEEIKAEAGK